MKRGSLCSVRWHCGDPEVFTRRKEEQIKAYRQTHTSAHRIAQASQRYDTTGTAHVLACKTTRRQQTTGRAEESVLCKCTKAVDAWRAVGGLSIVVYCTGGGGDLQNFA